MVPKIQRKNAYKGPALPKIAEKPIMLASAHFKASHKDWLIAGCISPSLSVTCRALVIQILLYEVPY